jgi:PAS domain S-box-containing protein
MEDGSKTKQDLIAELAFLRQRNAELEQVIRKSEDRYRTLVENADDVVFRTDDSGRFTFVNPAMCRISGYKEDEIIGKHYPILLRPDMCDDAMRFFGRQFVKRLQNTYSEYPIITKEGRFGQNTQLIFEDGHVTGFQAVARDITERKRAEEALLDANWRLESIIEGTRVGTWEWNVQTGETVFNEAWARIIGYTLDELAPVSIGTWERFAHPDDLKRSGELLERHFAGELPSYDLECRMRHKEGHWVWVHDRGRVITRTADGKPLMMFGIHTDITERKRTEENLVLNSRCTQVLLQLGQMTGASLKEITDFALEQAVALTRSKIGYLAFLNEDESVLAMHSWSKSAMAECAIADKPLLYPIEATGLWGEAVRQRRPVITNDYSTSPWRKGYPEGHVSVWRHMNTPVFLGSRIVLVAGVGNKAEAYSQDDVQQMTLIMEGMWRLIERKRAEEERRILEERLRQADKMEAVGTLAGGIAHDFNNLLMGIQGYASLTLMDMDPSHPHYERLKRIEEQVQSGADLTKQMLGFARGGRYEVKPTDMNDIIQKSSSMFGRTKKEITIHQKYGMDLRNVEVDRGQMEQVFMNLYVNAWQAMPGGGEIYLGTENVLLSDEETLPYAVTPGEYVKISVTDTGTGMDEMTRARIFDPFFTTKGMGRGTGLGLATVYGIIKGHKGMIQVESQPGSGTTFSIYLPASEKALVKEKREERRITRGTGTILLADDEKMVLEVSREMLEFLGYRVYPAGSGQEALAVYQEKLGEIDLVILDMIMPGMSGGETFDRLRGIDPGVRVLLSSGYSINGEAKTIMDRGCNGFIQKPFQLETFSRKIREMLD